MSISPNTLFAPYAYIATEEEKKIEPLFNPNREESFGLPFIDLPPLFVDGYNEAKGGIVVYKFDDIAGLLPEYADYEQQFEDLLAFIDSVGKVTYKVHNSDVTLDPEFIKTIVKEHWAKADGKAKKPKYWVVSGQRRTSSMPWLLALRAYLKDNPPKGDIVDGSQTFSDIDYSIEFQVPIVERSIDDLDGDPILALKLEMIDDNGDGLGKSAYDDVAKSHNWRLIKDSDNRLSDNVVGQKAQMVNKNGNFDKGGNERQVGLYRFNIQFPDCNVYSRLANSADLKYEKYKSPIKVTAFKPTHLRLMVGRLTKAIDARIRDFLASQQIVFVNEKRTDKSPSHDSDGNVITYVGEAMSPQVAERYLEFINHGTVDGQVIKTGSDNSLPPQQYKKLAENTSPRVFVEIRPFLEAMYDGDNATAKEIIESGFSIHNEIDLDDVREQLNVMLEAKLASV